MNGNRAVAWARSHALLVSAGLLALVLVVGIFVSTFRLYDERQARLAGIEALADENLRQNRQQCEDLNNSNQTLRELLDVSIRRRAAESFSAEDRRLAIDTYRRLPYTDCATGTRTEFSPPFP